MKIVIEKSKRLLALYGASGVLCLQCPVALGFAPVGHKQKEGDGKTPEGEYYVCLKRETGKFGCALGISYPSFGDAQAAGLDEELLALFEKAQSAQKRPPWGTPLGGEIYIHGGGTASDWTAGCVALDAGDMEKLFSLCNEGDAVIILP